MLREEGSQWVTLTLDVLGILLMDDWTTEIGCFRSSLMIMGFKRYQADLSDHL